MAFRGRITFLAGTSKPYMSHDSNLKKLGVFVSFTEAFLAIRLLTPALALRSVKIDEPGKPLAYTIQDTS